MTAALHTETGTVIPLDVNRWRSDPNPVERDLLATLADPVLDIGCGPGRITATLAADGRVALGIDPSIHAVAEARRWGLPVLQRSVFEPLPGEGRWASALLFDGNIGIGGDPHRLLRRIAALLRPRGEAMIEVEPPGTPTETLLVRLHAGHRASPPFAWARVGADDLPHVASEAGFTVTALDPLDRRWFARVVVS